MSERESPQTRVRCACRAWTSARECYRARYNDGDGLGEYGDDECGCYCHELKGFTPAPSTVPVSDD